ncbi:hypothetical protein CXG81DRAFT_21073 [Caulochytrium protostelioides]|uniref:Conserved oligomeric Golgi complex subunit 4 n=1 Tax=Caulochytrium protostelioides TaxID=1555241 RepID=A0A4P9X1K3_9FUNG|nr:hypothetical protein CXG81DRAFT_21073 [Caulochytrium protostelioides]|eukprot:RKO98758.1 hypothetical protein CXG81DRAFT_21073 [Caulochytrium protostelioides]
MVAMQSLPASRDTVRTAAAAGATAAAPSAAAAAALRGLGSRVVAAPSSPPSPSSPGPAPQAAAAARASSAPRLSLEQCHQLRDIETIRRQLVLLSDEETQLDGELQTLLTDQQHVTTALTAIDGLAPRFDTALTHVGHVAATVADAAALADAVARKVRQLDREQRHVKATIAQVEALYDLRRCASAAASALDAGDDDAVANALQRFLQIDLDRMAVVFGQDAGALSSLLGPDAVPDALRPPADAVAEVASAIPTLEAVRQRFEAQLDEGLRKAMEAGDHAAVVRRLQLFPRIGHADRGIAHLVAYMSRQVRQVRDDAARLDPTVSPIFYAEVLTKIYEKVAALVHEQQQQLESLYGNSLMPQLLPRVYDETQIQVGVVLDAFAERRRFWRRVADARSRIPSDMTDLKARFSARRIKQAAARALHAHAQAQGADRLSSPTAHADGSNGSGSSGSGGDLDAGAEIGALNQLLMEAAGMCLRTSIFHRFMAGRGLVMPTPSTKTTATAGPTAAASATTTPRSAELVGAIDRLAEGYLTLELAFLLQSMHRALANEEVLTGGDRIHAFVDDLFFIVRSSTDRLLLLNDAAVAAHALVVLSTMWTLAYLQTVQKRVSAVLADEQARQPTVRHAVIIALPAAASATGAASSAAHAASAAAAAAAAANPAQAGAVSPRSLLWVYLNDLETSLRYTHAFLGHLETQLDATFPAAAVAAPLAERLDAGTLALHEVRTSTQALAETWTRNVYNGVLRSRVRAFVAALPYAYDLDSEAAFDAAEAAGRMPRALAAGLDALLRAARAALTPPALRRLGALVLKGIAAAWERALLGRLDAATGTAVALPLPSGIVAPPPPSSAAAATFGADLIGGTPVPAGRVLRVTPLGAIRFEKDLRALAAQAGALCPAPRGEPPVPVRALLSRLFQLAALWQIEVLSDLPEEIEHILSPRGLGLGLGVAPSGAGTYAARDGIDGYGAASRPGPDHGNDPAAAAAAEAEAQARGARLTATEIRHALALRADFEAADVEAAVQQLIQTSGGLVAA